MKYAIALTLAAIGLAGCAEKRPMTVAEFMENEVALYGTLSRCENNPATVDPAECLNARQAAERLAAINERALRKAREEAFQSAREEYRQRLDREHQLRLQAEAAAAEARLQALTTSSPPQEAPDAVEAEAGAAAAAEAEAEALPAETDTAEEEETPEPGQD